MQNLASRCLYLGDISKTSTKQHVLIRIDLLVSVLLQIDSLPALKHPIHLKLGDRNYQVSPHPNDVVVVCCPKLRPRDEE